MYYANALTVRDRMKALVAGTQPPPRVVVLDSAGQDSLDITSADMLKELLAELKGKGMDIYVAELHVPVQGIQPADRIARDDRRRSYLPDR